MAKRERHDAEALLSAEAPAQSMLEIPVLTYEFDYNVNWKSCRVLGCLVRCVYQSNGSELDGQWMRCNTCSAMFCEAHRKHDVHGDGHKWDSDQEEEYDEEVE